MADLGFLPGVTRILAATPAGGQRMLFSATLDNGVDKLVRRFLSDPVTHSVDEIDAPPPAMTHHVFHVAGAAEKRDLVQRLASGTGRRILFMRTKHQARKLARQLTETGPASICGLKPGQAVTVMADDYGRDPIKGTLVASSAHRISIARNDPAVGDVVVHFPRAGFWVLPG